MAEQPSLLEEGTYMLFYVQVFEFNVSAAFNLDEKTLAQVEKIKREVEEGLFVSDRIITQALATDIEHVRTCRR